MRLVLRFGCAAALAGVGWAVLAAEKTPTASPTKSEKSSLAPAVVAPAAAQPKSSAKIVVGEVAVVDADAKPATVKPAVPPIAPTSRPAPTPVSQVQTDSQVHLSLGTLSPTPDMWYYEQARADYHNPALQVRMKAEADAAARRARLNAQEWYGHSNSRPIAHCTPFTYYYSPMWASNSRNPYIWSARSGAPVIFQAYNVMGVSGAGVW